MSPRLERVSRALFRAYFAFVVVFLFFPLFIVVPMSFNDAQFLSFPPAVYSVRWYRTYFSDPVWLQATLLSLRVSLAATAIATVLGTLAAVGWVRSRFRARNVVYALIVAPMIVPTVIVALGVFLVYSRLRLIESEWGLVAAHAVVALPYVVLIVSATLQQFDVTLERAARVLGATPVRAFLSVALPAIAPAVFAAALFAFFVSFDELLIALFVMGGSQTLPMRIWSDLRFEFNPTVSAVATLLIVVTALGMSLAEILRRRAATRLAPQSTRPPEA